MISYKPSLVGVFLFLFAFSNGQTKELAEQKFKDYLEQGFKYHDNRKLDSCKYFLRKVDSLVRLNQSDSTKFYQKELLEASLFVRENKMDEAIGKLLKANQFFKNQKDSANIGLSLYKLGVANYYVNRRLVAGDYFDKITPYKKFVSKRLLTRVHQNYGTINLEVGLLSKPKDRVLINKAIKNYEEAIKIYAEENWLMEKALATSLLAECYNQLEDYDSALVIINQAVSLSEEANNKSQLGFALIKKTTILGNKRQFEKALNTIAIAKPIFRELEDKPTYLYALNEEKKILVGLNRYKEASIVSDSILQVSVENYDTRFADKVAEMDAKYDSVEKEKEIAQQKEQLLAQELNIKNRTLSTILLASALLILGIITFGLYKRHQFKRKQLNKELELKDALAKIKTQNKLQEQRLRISRDLHDNIGSQLTFIISSIDNLAYINKNASAKLKEKLSEISSFTGDTIYQLRDTIWAMNKSEISADDLQARILGFIDKAQSIKPDINFLIEFKIDPDKDFTSKEGIYIFRIIQEAINNAIKYAEAKSIDILVIEKENRIEFSISDDGVGFDENSIEFGNGLNNMQKRASEINADISINSKVNQGTSIVMII